jgi:hypothetical protein
MEYTCALEILRMSDLISNVLSDPWVPILVAWVMRLFLLCLLAGLVRVIYRLTIAHIVRFPYPATKPKPGMSGWFQGARRRLKRFKLGLPGVAEAEFEGPFT